MNKPKYFCCICGSAITYGMGNNPAPIAVGGRCCDNCNTSVVIPARLAIAAANNKPATEAARKEETR